MRENGLFSQDSPLTRIPTNLNPRQKHLLDGFVVAARMAELHWTGLRSSAHTYSLLSSTGQARPPEAELLVIYSHAWGVVDHVSRMRKFASALNPQGFSAFLNETQNVVGIRNTFQHLPARVLNIAPEEPSLGTLVWVHVPEACAKECGIVLARLGTPRPGLGTEGVDPVTLADRARGPVDRFVLVAWEPAYGKASKYAVPKGITPGPNKIAVSLTDTWASVEDVVARTDAVLGPQFNGAPSMGLDLSLYLHIGPPEESVAPNTELEPS